MKIYLIAFINLFFAFISYSQSNWNSTYYYPLKDAMSKVKDPFKKNNLKNNYASVLKTSTTKGVDIDGKAPNVTLRILQSKLAVPNKYATELQQKTNPNYDLNVIISDFSLLAGRISPIRDWFIGDGNKLSINGYLPMVFEFLIDDNYSGTFYTLANNYGSFDASINISEIPQTYGKLFRYTFKNIELSYHFNKNKFEYFGVDEDNDPSTDNKEENFKKWMNFIKNLKSGNKLYIRFLGFADTSIHDDNRCLNSIPEMFMRCMNNLHSKYRFEKVTFESSTYEFSLKGSSNALSF
tara:strand:- start:530 stop:1414 length:885 start_codon:yes stop_codon:yes gene_type:complete